MRLRLATLDDMPVLERLVRHAGIELEERFGTPRMDTVVLLAMRYGIDTGQAVAVAEQGDDIVAWCARVHMPGMPDGYAEGLGTWVWEPYRKEHVGRDLRRFTDEHAARCGIEYVTGVAAVGNDAGLQSCLREGYEVVGTAVRKRLPRRDSAPREKGTGGPSAVKADGGGISEPETTPVPMDASREVR